MFKSHSQPPILHASKEARSIGLQYYELSFEAKTAAMIGQVDVEISIPPRVYVHWEYDIICPMPIKNIEEFRLRIHDQFVFSLEYFRTSPKIRRLALSTKRAEIGNILFSPLTALEEVLLYHEVPELDRRFGINDPISLELVQVVEKVEVEQEDSTQERHLRFSYLRRVIPVYFCGVCQTNEGQASFGKIPVGWNPPVFTPSCMIIKRRSGVAVEGAAWV
jgi:hypothetical protein